MNLQKHKTFLYKLLLKITVGIMQDIKPPDFNSQAVYKKDHTNRIPNTICLGCETLDITSPQIKNAGPSCAYVSLLRMRQHLDR